jgi:hypothetical protein
MDWRVELLSYRASQANGSASHSSDVVIQIHLADKLTQGFWARRAAWRDKVVSSWVTVRQSRVGMQLYVHGVFPRAYGIVNVIKGGGAGHVISCSG